jgi:hypothetical protein
MKESDLYIPTRDWLIARGHEVHVEIFDTDIVTILDGELWAIELKPCLTQGLVHQLNARSQWADRCLAVIASDPRSTAMLKYYGHGLLQVKGGKISQRIKPQPQPFGWHKRRKYRIKRLVNRTPAMDHEIAGLPNGPQRKSNRRARPDW